MKLVYLPSALQDLVWMRHYYRDVFPEGARRAREKIRSVERLLLDNPEIGHVAGEGGVREFPILRTPFSVIYRSRPGRLEVLRLWDNRADPGDLDH
jgi:plasmid stabilization system protein ParE